MTCRIGFLLIPRFSALGFLCAAEPLRVANRLAEQEIYEWRLCSLDGAPVTASSGMAFPVDMKLEANAPFDWLVICAGFTPLAGITTRHLALLRQLARRNTQIGGVDTGAFILARAGMARDMPLTMHWEARPAFAEAFPDHIASSELFEDRQSVFTSSGGTASMDLMLSRIAQSRGRAFAQRVSEQFIHTTIRPSHDAQRARPAGRSPVRTTRLGRALALMERETARRLDAAEIALEARCSVRQVERIFLDQFGCGPQAHHRTLRLAKARAMLRETPLPIAEIALECGFESRSRFSVAYKAAFGRAPARDRVEPV